MRLKKFSLSIVLVLAGFYSLAQVPQAMNYQAIARNNDGSTIPGKNIGVRFSILDGSANGTVLYQETQQSVTNNFGLFTLAIGRGLTVTGDFTSIDWGAVSKKYLKVEISLQGGGNYQLQGTTEFLSVPYALYAEKTKLVAGSGITITNGNIISANGTSYVAGNAITINGNTIAANYQAGPGINITGNTISSIAASYVGGNAISITGNTIAANYQAGVGINITGNTISATAVPYVAGNAISITGNTIAANYQAGVGINITGTTISATTIPYVAGNAISITGNTIAANYQAGVGINITGNTIAGAYVAGPGISITGNTIAATSASGWLLNGNAGTTAANFIGTTDNQFLHFRTNNVTRARFYPSISTFGTDASVFTLSEEADVQNRPVQFTVFGRDICGGLMPAVITSFVGGGTAWGFEAGKTLGRFFRLSQMNTSVFTQSHYYDVGMSQDSSFYISEHGLQNVGGYMPKKMFTISAQNRVGINMAMNEKPTADFHTRGTVRFQDIITNNTYTRLLAMDANGNLGSRDVSSLPAAGGFWVADAEGIHNNNASGNVGIGGDSKNINRLTVNGSATQPYTVEVNSVNTWQTVLNIYNNSSNWRWALTTGGAANTQPNYGVGPGNFGIANDRTSSANTTFPIIITTDDKVGIGMGPGGSNSMPKTQLHVKTGDIYIEQVTSGVIMKSPNGQCWRMTVSNAGAPVFTAITCP